MIPEEEFLSMIDLQKTSASIQTLLSRYDGLRETYAMFAWHCVERMMADGGRLAIPNFLSPEERAMLVGAHSLGIVSLRTGLDDEGRYISFAIQGKEIYDRDEVFQQLEPRLKLFRERMFK